MKIYKIALLSFLGMATMIGCSDDEDLSTNNDDTIVDDDNGNNPGDDEMMTQSFTADLSTLNNSGVLGTMTATVDNNSNTLTVSIDASSMTPNQTHPQHIHGMDDGSNATCPDMSADTDGNGRVSINEGAPFYGPVQIPLQDFPSADSNGDISYTKTFTLVDSNADVDNDEVGRAFINSLSNRAIVLHGMNVNGQYQATLPVACGQVREDIN